MFAEERPLQDFFEEPPSTSFTVLRCDSPESSSAQEEDEKTAEMSDLFSKITRKKCGYNEKMEMIAEELHKAALPRAHTGELLLSIPFNRLVAGGYARFEELDRDLLHATGVSGSVLADAMGFASFEKMCLNSPQVIEMFTWSRQKEEYCGRTTHRVFGFTPRLNSQLNEFDELQHFQLLGLDDRADDPVRKFVDEHRQKGEFPDEKELAVSFSFFLFASPLASVPKALLPNDPFIQSRP